MDFSFATRSELIQKLQAQSWDVLVIGGGVTGAAVARDAALRGLKVALLEAGDFASATSSGSTKLFHGGIRYLENYEFKLVFEAIREREQLSRLYAPFIKPLSFVFPTYKDGVVSRWKLNLGLLLYDAFSFFKQRHQNLNRATAIDRFPLLKPSRLTGACVYADSFAEDYRIVVELIKSAFHHGALPISRFKVTQLEKQSSGDFAIEACDQWNSSTPIRMTAKAVINCSGPFADSVRGLLGKPPVLKLTQGIHLIVERARLPLDEAYVFTDTKLHRILFAIPWKSVTYLGTTDTSVEKVEDAQTQKTDVDYVLEIINQFLNAGLTPADVIQSWAAVRPLIKPEGPLDNSRISREHKIEEGPENYFDVLGGKLTSHRLMAEEALELLQRKWKFGTSKTSGIPLYEESGLKPTTEIEHRLFERYGASFRSVLNLDHDRGLNRQTLRAFPDYLVSEVLYSIHHEMCLDPIDFIRRRSSLYYETQWNSQKQRDLLTEIVQIFEQEMKSQNRTPDRLSQESLANYRWDSEGWKK
jgi:glycerol-3-phosphate dehydrogenase